MAGKTPQFTADRKEDRLLILGLGVLVSREAKVRSVSEASSKLLARVVKFQGEI